MTGQEGHYDPNFDISDHDRASALIAEGINPYDEEEARASGVEHIPEGIERSGLVSAVKGERLTPRQRAFLKEGTGLRDVPIDRETTRKIELLSKYFPGRFGKGAPQDLTRARNTSEQTGRLYNNVFDFYSGK